MRSLSLRGQLAERILARAADIARDPVKRRRAQTGSDYGTRDYAMRYAREQFRQRVTSGMGLSRAVPDVVGRDVLELGCGHGGISAFLGALGARRVLGVDVNEPHLEVARALVAALDAEGVTGLSARTTFACGDVHALQLPDASFDVVLADNLFEHVDRPDQVMCEAFRVLRPGGALVVPTFSSIWSKWGLHLKNGLRLPWLNLVFDETTIVHALALRAARHPALYDAYPGLRGEPRLVRDVRRHRDLNQITHASFLALAQAAGFTVASFELHLTPAGRVLGQLLPPGPQRELFDVLSTGAGAVLLRPRRSDGAGDGL